MRLMTMVKMICGIYVSGTRRHKTVLSGQGTILSWQFRGKAFENVFGDSLKNTKVFFLQFISKQWLHALDSALGKFETAESQMASGAVVWLTRPPFEQTNKLKSDTPALQ